MNADDVLNESVSPALHGHFLDRTQSTTRYTFFRCRRSLHVRAWVVSPSKSAACHTSVLQTKERILSACLP